MSEKDAKKLIREKTPIDRIIEMYREKGYWEVLGSAGGDYLHYRVYDNGNVYER